MINFLFFLMMFMSKGLSQEAPDFQKIQIYVDISEVHVTADGSKGTSMPLNILLSHFTHNPQAVERKMTYWSNPNPWRGSVTVYDWQNIKHMPTFSECDYSDAISCGIKNSHWTLRTVVLVGDKYSTITMKLYDENGVQISKGLKTAWGTIRWKPQWKLTKITEKGPYGGGTKEVFEMWPPKLEELPPLIKPYHIGQAVYGVFDVMQSSCRMSNCRHIKIQQGNFVRQ